MIDRVKVTLISGKGGDGKVAFLHEKGKAMGGPAGGNGGKGGSIYIKAQTGYNTLTAYRFGKTIKAPNGENGHEKTCMVNMHLMSFYLFQLVLSSRIWKETF